MFSMLTSRVQSICKMLAGVGKEREHSEILKSLSFVTCRWAVLQISLHVSRSLFDMGHYVICLGLFLIWFRMSGTRKAKLLCKERSPRCCLVRYHGTLLEIS